MTATPTMNEIELETARAQRVFEDVASFQPDFSPTTNGYTRRASMPCLPRAQKESEAVEPIARGDEDETETSDAQKVFQDVALFKPSFGDVASRSHDVRASVLPVSALQKLAEAEGSEKTEIELETAHAQRIFEDGASFKPYFGVAAAVPIRPSRRVSMPNRPEKQGKVGFYEVSNAFGQTLCDRPADLPSSVSMTTRNSTRCRTERRSADSWITHEKGASIESGGVVSECNNGVSAESHLFCKKAYTFNTDGFSAPAESLVDIARNMAAREQNGIAGPVGHLRPQGLHLPQSDGCCQRKAVESRCKSILALIDDTSEDDIIHNNVFAKPVVGSLHLPRTTNFRYRRATAPSQSLKDCASMVHTDLVGSSARCGLPAKVKGDTTWIKAVKNVVNGDGTGTSSTITMAASVSMASCPASPRAGKCASHDTTSTCSETFAVMDDDCDKSMSSTRSAFRVKDVGGSCDHLWESDSTLSFADEDVSNSA